MIPRRSLAAAIAGALLLSGAFSAARAQTETVLYHTGFEFTEGFDPAYTVVGQGNWVGSADGGNGLATGFFDGLGQHAFVGFSVPDPADTPFVNIWKPINHVPATPSQSIVRFSTVMQIVPSTNGRRDDFRWSLYNRSEHRLFTLDFATTELQLSYLLDNTTNYVATGLGFDLEGFYDLVIWMDFGRNLWTALLNDVVVVNSKPITASGAALNLGDINAVWAIRQPGSPGNNFMVFDEYHVAVVNVPSVPPTVEAIGPRNDGAFVLRIYAQQNLNYAIEATANWASWQTLGTFQAPAGGVFDFADPQAPQNGQRFYRVRQAP